MPIADPSHANTFAVFALIAAPAVLTNASSVLALGTSNRFARAVDRQRELSRILDKSEFSTAAEGELRLGQLHRTERRAQLLIKSLMCFYMAMGSFAAASLMSLIGAVLDLQAASLAYFTGLAAIGVGLTGVSGLIFGSILLFRETRITLRSLREEAAFSQERFRLRNL